MQKHLKNEIERLSSEERYASTSAESLLSSILLDLAENGGERPEETPSQKEMEAPNARMDLGIIARIISREVFAEEIKKVAISIEKYYGPGIPGEKNTLHLKYPKNDT